MAFSAAAATATAGGVPSAKTTRLAARPTPARSAVDARRAAAVAPLAATTHEPVEAILFDMDGVLTLSEELSREVGARVLEAVCRLQSVHPDEFIPFMGTGEANFLGGVARARGVPGVDALVPALKDAFFESYIAACTAPGAPSIEAPGARALVSACRAAGLKTAVATAADLIKADANLRAAGFDPGASGRFDPYFDALVTADAFERLKPAPDAFLAAAAAVGVPPARCVVIEDAPAGIAAARAAGMRVLGITSTLDAAAMDAEGPDGIAGAPREVTPELLQALRLREGVVLGA